MSSRKEMHATYANLGAVSWSLGLSRAALVVLVCGFVFCHWPWFYVTMIRVDAVMQNSHPGAGATDEDVEKWGEQQRQVAAVAYPVVTSAYTVLATLIGVPASGLLVANIVVMRRMRSRLTRSLLE